MMFQSFFSLSALSILLVSANAQPLTSSASSLLKRLDNIPLNATLPIVKASYLDLGLTDQCNRTEYRFDLSVEADVDLLHNTTYRFLVGQARNGPQGPFLDGSKVFLDHSYLPSQNTGNNPYEGSDPNLNFSLIAFDMYNSTQVGELLSDPWVLSTENNSQGTIVPGQFTAVVFVDRPEFIPNGSTTQMPEPIWKVFTPGLKYGSNCTPAFTNTKSLKAAQGLKGTDGASTASIARGLGASLALAAAGTMLL